MIRALFFLIFCVGFLQAAEPLAVSPELFDKRLREAITVDPSQPVTVGLIKIEDRTTGISQATWLYVKQALEYYKKSKPAFVILELNTPGGEVFPAQQISDALKELDTQFNIPIVAYINNWAISAGAMLAYSARFIVIAKDAAMGAAEPLTVQMEKTEVASEKVNSALRADFANRASFFGRDPNIAEAMVDKDIILVVRQGKIVRLDSEDQIHHQEPDPDLILSPKGKLLTLNAEQLIKYGVADHMFPPTKLPLPTEAEQAAGKWPASKNVLFTDPYLSSLNATVDEYQMDWKTQFFVLLAHPVVSSALFLGLMLGFYMEMSSPGFGLPGTVALTCLFLIILSSLSLQIAHWLELILLLTGLAVILLELFVLPTFGLLGFIGILLFLAGLFGMMIPGLSSVNFDFDAGALNAAGEAALERLAWFAATFLLGCLLIVLLARYVTPSLATFSRFVLKGNEQEGFIAGESPHSLPKEGARGTAFSALRPAGKILIENTIYDAITVGGYIEKGAPIAVDRLDGSVIVVKEVA